MPKTDKLVIFGTAEIAALAYYYFQNDTNYQVVGFCVDDEFFSEEKFQGLTVVPFSKVAKLFPPSSYEMHVALSYARFNKLREEKYLQAKAAGYKLASYICSRSTYWSDLSHGDNCFILEDQTIQPTVNIGNRQDGRLKSDSIIDCRPEKKDIQNAILLALSSRFKSTLENVKNPYGNVGAAQKILAIIESLEPKKLLQKKFYDL